MSRDGTDALQAALFAVLSDEFGDTSAPVPVFDHVPQSIAYPYIVIGDGSSVDWGTKDSVGTEQDVQIEVWSRYRGRKEAHQISARIYDRLHEQALSVADQQCVLIRFESEERTREADGQSYRVALRYRALLDHDTG